MPKLRVPPPYRGPTRGAAEVDVDGSTVGECLDAAEVLHAGFRDQVVGPDGAVHGFVQLFLNGDLLDGAALSTPVEQDDEIQILAAIAGG